MKSSRLKSDPDKIQAWKNRSRDTAIAKARALKRSVREIDPRPIPRKRREDKRIPGATGWTQRVFALHGRCCIVCGARAAQGHHVVPRQAILTARHLSQEDRLTLAYDARNGVPVCLRCHEKHEQAVERIPFARLPLSVVDWAVEHGFRQRVFDRRIYTRERTGS